ncbi:hypothetical protein [Haloprofundus halophilus]|uniref:hypothetical protein n=1 Tax=Haloprofundus halophilus TaxID=2283527 RepID=UPI000E438F61|nr:hypothetical protein [Haloprofundus halophilus]
MRRYALLFVVFGLLVAGCTSVPPADDSPETIATESPTEPPATTSPTPTTDGHSTTAYADCPYLLHVELADEDRAAGADRTLAYENLSADRRTEFDRARENGTLSMESLPDTWSAPRIVEYEGEAYETVAATC